MDDIRKLSEISVPDATRKELQKLNQKYGFNRVDVETWGSLWVALWLLIGMVLAVSTPVIRSSPSLTLLVYAASAGSGCGFGILAYWLLHRYRSGRMTVQLRLHYEGLRRSLPEIDNFNRRLKGLQQLAELSEPHERPGADVVAKYYGESIELKERHIQFLEESERQVKARLREAAIRSLEKVFAENYDGKFRETRDVSDMVYLNLARSAEERVPVTENEEAVTSIRRS